MRIAVVGGAGYIGSHMCKFLGERGHDVVVVDDLSTGHREAVKWGRLVECSILDRAALAAVFGRERFDCVIHFASLIVVGESISDPLTYYAHNVAGTLNLLAQMRATGIRKLVFSSSAAVYGQPVEQSIREGHPIAPINPYGQSKAMIEVVLQDLANASILDSVALRYFNAAGADPSGQIGEAHEPETHLIPRLLAAAAGAGGPIEIFGRDHPTPDGSCIRDYVHVNDLASAHLRAIEFLEVGKGFHAFNLGNGSGFSVLEVLQAVEAVTGRKLKASTAPRRVGDPARLVACNDKARRVLGWEPAIPSIDSIIESAWRWHQNPAY